MIKNEPCWYAIYTKPRAEKKTNELLIRKGITVFLPIQQIMKQWSDRKKKVEEPLFKSYLFVRIEYERQHLEVLQTAGVVKFVQVGKEIVSIRDAIIEAIQISLLHYSEIDTTTDSLKLEQKVKVRGGPLRGFEGVVVEQHGNKYFAIRIEQIGTHVLVKIPAAYLESNQ